MDVGSGEGYLGQVLHHEYGMSVVGVDERSEFTEGAQQRAHFIHKEREARDRKANPNKPVGEKEEARKMTHEERVSAREADMARRGVKHVVATITLDMVPEHFELIAWPTDPPRKAILVGYACLPSLLPLSSTT